MKTVPLVVSVGLVVALSSPVAAWAEAAAPQFQAVAQEISEDREGFVHALAEKWMADQGERAVTALELKLLSIPLHRLVAAAQAQSEAEFMSAAGVGPEGAAAGLGALDVGAGGITPQFFPPPEFNTKLEYTAVPPCRVMDTRKWNQVTSLTVPGAHAVEANMSNTFGDIPQQGGDPAGCPQLPPHAAAYAVTITGIAPGFPGSGFPGPGFATLIPWDWGANWTYDGSVAQPPAPAGNTYNTYNFPPFRQAATITWDGQTGLIANTTIVQACDGCNWHTWLYASGTAHFTLDVVGYFDETNPCDVMDLYNRGMCYELLPRPPADFHTAELLCAWEQGRLPIVAEVHPLLQWGLNQLVPAGPGEWTSDMVWDDIGSFHFQNFAGPNPPQQGAMLANPFGPPALSSQVDLLWQYRCVHPAAD
jgi:hypothetical protein